MNPDKILRNLDHGYFMTYQEQFEAAQYIRQLQQAVLDEREACAKLCEARGNLHDGLFGNWAQDIAERIRARNKHD